jgi:hypothetical protein
MKKYTQLIFLETMQNIPNNIGPTAIKSYSSKILDGFWNKEAVRKKYPKSFEMQYLTKHCINCNFVVVSNSIQALK